MAMDNNSGRYSPLAALTYARQDKTARQAMAAGEEKDTLSNKVVYETVLNWVQERISSQDEYKNILMKTLDTKEGGDEQLQNIISRLLQSYPIAIDEEVAEEFKKRIFNDMTGFGILTKFIEDPNIEEINGFGCGPYQIEILPSGKKKYMLEEGFNSPEDILNVVKRMVRRGNMTIDQSNPRVDSYLDSGTRVSAMIPPVIREDKGAVFSIRKQTKSKITVKDLVASASAMPEEFELMQLFVQNKVSGAIVGATGSGKTTILNFLLSDYVEHTPSHRVYIIEESRELQLPSNACVIYTAVCGDEKNGTLVDASSLLKSALRFHPTLISCAEMRGEEAMNAMTAAQTGHIVWSTFHADNCVEAYPRLLTMCKMSGTDLSEALLMQNLVSAFPIIISTQQLKDGTRKITGIFEAEGVDGVKVKGHYIYKLQVTSFDYNEDGTVRRVCGYHSRVGNISDELAQRIFDNCGKADIIRKFARPGWQPASLAAAQAKLSGENK